MCMCTHVRWVCMDERAFFCSLSVCLLICLPVCLSVCLSMCMHVAMYVYIYVCFFVWLCVGLYRSPKELRYCIWGYLLVPLFRWLHTLLNVDCRPSISPAMRYPLPWISVNICVILCLQEHHHGNLWTSVHSHCNHLYSDVLVFLIYPICAVLQSAERKCLCLLSWG